MNNNLQKGFAVPALIAIVAVLIVAGGGAYYARHSQTEDEKMAEEKAMMEKKEDEGMMEDDAMMEKDAMMKENDGAMMDKGEAMMKHSGAMLAGTSAPLLDFTKADYDAAVKTGKLVVLYFYANWCPICKAEFPLMQKAFNALTTDKVVGFRVNYNDSQTDSDEKNLAKEFGVAYQHTKVFVKNGTRVLKSPEGWDETRYTAEISKALAQ